MNELLKTPFCSASLEFGSELYVSALKSEVFKGKGNVASYERGEKQEDVERSSAEEPPHEIIMLAAEGNFVLLRFPFIHV